MCGGVKRSTATAMLEVSNTVRMSGSEHLGALPRARPTSARQCVARQRAAREEAGAAAMETLIGRNVSPVVNSLYVLYVVFFDFEINIFSRFSH